MRSVALDLGARKVSYCEVAHGRVVRRETVKSVQDLEREIGPEAEPAVVAIEACREAWFVHDLLTRWDNRVVLVDTTRSRRLGIGAHGRKTDRIDAEVLALALERGGIPIAHVLSPHRRELRRQLGVRRGLVETRSQLVTTVRGLLREQGISLPGCNTEHFVAQARKHVRADVLPLLEPTLAVLTVIEPQIEAVETELARLCTSEPIVQVLTTTPGVGAIVAAAFVSVIDDAKRFRHAHAVESYVGLVPSEDTTGGKRRLGSITKKGNGYLRALLVQAAWSLLRTAGSDDPLRQWAEAVAKRRGKRVAVIALARRLVGVLWALWRDASVYDAQHLSKKSAKGMKAAAQSLAFRAEALERAAKKHSTRRLTAAQEATATS